MGVFGTHAVSVYIRVPCIYVHNTVPTFNSCTKCADIPGIIHDRTPDHHSVSGAWMRPDIPDLATKRTLDSQATRINDVLGLYFDMLSMGVCTTR